MPGAALWSCTSPLATSVGRSAVRDVGTRTLGSLDTAGLLAAVRSFGRHLTDGLVLVDQTERVRWLNPAARRLLGCGLARARGVPLPDLLQPLGGDQRGPPTALRWGQVVRPGRRQPLRLLVEPIPLHEGGAVAGTLYLLVRPEQSGMATTSQRLAPLIASLSHEIRAPLAAALAALDLLDDPAARPDLAALAQSARRSVLWLAAMVGNLVTATTLSTGEISLALGPLALRPLVADTAAYLAPLLARKQQTLIIDSPADEIVVVADRQGIQQVLINLITNAIKYGPFGQPIRVGLGVQGEHARVTVSDRGPGIPLAEQAQVFERFHRAGEAPASGRGGVGLGLAIVRAIVERHGGTVGVRSLPGRGSAFWFTLPLHRPCPTVAP